MILNDKVSFSDIDRHENMKLGTGAVPEYPRPDRAHDLTNQPTALGRFQSIRGLIVPNDDRLHPTDDLQKVIGQRFLYSKMFLGKGLNYDYYRYPDDCDDDSPNLHLHIPNPHDMT